jgi:hypothetical protein
MQFDQQYPSKKYQVTILRISWKYQVSTIVKWNIQKTCLWLKINLVHYNNISHYFSMGLIISALLSGEYRNKFGSTCPKSCLSSYHLKSSKDPKELNQNSKEAPRKRHNFFHKNSYMKTITKSCIRTFNKSFPLWKL